MKSYSIGVFDSGIGGLTVLKKLKQVLPYEDFIYFGDTARVPYGSKSKETIQNFASQIIDFLIEKKIKIAIVACNTVSSLALTYLQNKYKNIPIFGVVIPGSNKAAVSTKNKKVGVIGTVATINSNSYKKEILSIDNKIKIYQKACPLFVPLVENGWANTDIALLTAKKYLSPLIEKNIDSLVLGCTHYPVLKRTIKKIVGNNVKIIDSATEIAKDTKQFLAKNNLLKKSSKKGKTEYWLSDKSIYFIKSAKYILNEDIKINLKKL